MVLLMLLFGCLDGGALHGPVSAASYMRGGLFLITK